MNYCNRDISFEYIKNLSYKEKSPTLTIKEQTKYMIEFEKEIKRNLELLKQSRLEKLSEGGIE